MSYDSSLIHKIQKAKLYAEEPERIHFDALRARVDGNHGTHIVTFADGRWECDCEFFAHHSTCAHVMAVERVLGVMAPKPAVA